MEISNLPLVLELIIPGFYHFFNQFNAEKIQFNLFYTTCYQTVMVFSVRYMVIDEDPFPSLASVNIVATDFRAMLNVKKD